MGAVSPNADSAAVSRAALVLALAVGLPYCAGGAVWDDHALIVDGLAPLRLADLPSLWTHAVGGGDTGATYYRPAAMTVLALAGRFGIPAVHAVVVLLHGISAMLLARSVRLGWVGLVALSVFVAHPLTHEVLGWASALPDALAVALSLGAVGFVGRYPVAGMALAALAVLSKESALVVLLAAAWALVPTRGDRWVLVAGVGAAWALRLSAGVTVPPLDFSLTEAVGAWLSQLSRYVWPFPLSAVRDTHGISWGELVVGGGVAIVGVGVALRFPRTRPGWLLLALAPAVALPTTLTSHLAADRYLYPGLLGGVWVVVALVSAWNAARAGETLARPPPAETLAPRAPEPLRGGGSPNSLLFDIRLLPLVMLILAVHWRASRPWKDDIALFAAAVDAQPESSYAAHFLGHAHAMAGDWKPASAAFVRAAGLPYAHPVSAGLALECLVRAGESEAAMEFAANGPKDGLTADWLAWWAQAAVDVGDYGRADALLRQLAQADGRYDGPPFVADLAREVAEQRKRAP